jgi:hypothetical protein
MGPFTVIGAVVTALFRSFVDYIRMQKRSQPRMVLAKKLGLRFDLDKDMHLADRYRFLDKLRTGGYWFAFNRFWGNYRGCEVTIFDYHYEMRDRGPSHDYYSCFILRLPRSVPRLTIAGEELSSKIAQAFGYDDIDFESHEFSRKFCVRSPDKKFAYDICNARMMEYLLANDDLTIEVDQDTVALTFNSRLDPPRIEPNLSRLVALRSLMPEYLFSGSSR